MKKKIILIPIIMIGIITQFLMSCSEDDNTNNNTSTNKAPTAPSNPYPYNSEVQVNSMDLSWSASTDPEGDPITYDIYLGTSLSPGKLASNLTNTTYTANLNDYTVYTWKVVAKDNHNNSTSSTLWSFTTRDLYHAPEKPYNMYPTDNATNVSRSVTLSWRSSHTTFYDVYLGTSNPPSQVQTVTNEEYSVGSLNANTKYYWQIFAGGQVGGTYSDIYSFTTTP